ncbi:MAG TPA: hypothetical protein VFR14_12580 [Candidatus Limnocylindrales bacterium]|nr:hypothetical protein [Candidatus Limnocylindrales bacterium]
MTFDVLVIALAALVASNVVLLVAATRSGSAGRQGAAGHASHESRHLDGPPVSRDRIEWAELPVGRPDVGASRAWHPTPRSVAPAAVSTETEPPSVAAANGRPDPADVASARMSATAALEPATEAPAEAPPDAPVGPPLVGRPEPAPETPPARRSPARSDARRSGAGKRGRRFTLPSIEVDHERTERVVLSLLTGDDEIALAADAAEDVDAAGGHMVDAWERLVGSDAAGEPARAAVVVALTLDGLDRLTEVAGRDGADRAIGGALDAIRRSARGSDRVASVGRGHFRVLLVDADAVVAARFVARVRETLERRPALASTSVALAAGWAEAHTAGHLEGAVHAAEERRRSDADPRARRSGDGSPA